LLEKLTLMQEPLLDISADIILPI